MAVAQGGRRSQGAFRPARLTLRMMTVSFVSQTLNQQRHVVNGLTLSTLCWESELTKRFLAKHELARHNN